MLQTTINFSFSLLFLPVSILSLSLFLSILLSLCLSLLSLLYSQIILKHFYLRSHDILQDCSKWKRQLIKGIQSLGVSSTSGSAVQLRNHLTNLMKQSNDLNHELTNIKLSDFNE